MSDRPVIKSNLYVGLGTALRLQSGRRPVCIRTFASRNRMDNASLAWDYSCLVAQCWRFHFRLWAPCNGLAFCVTLRKRSLLFALVGLILGLGTDSHPVLGRARCKCPTERRPWPGCCSSAISSGQLSLMHRGRSRLRWGF